MTASRTGFQPLLFMRHARCASFGMSIGRAVSCRTAACIASMRFRIGRKMNMVNSRPMLHDHPTEERPAYILHDAIKR